MSNTERNSRGPIKLTPDLASQMLRAGDLTRVIDPVPPLPNTLEARAKQLFGKDFLGHEAVRFMEKKCHEAGINVWFETPDLEFPYSEQDLISAKEDENTDEQRFVSLRPLGMNHNGEGKSITIANLIDLFKDVNPFGDGVIFRQGGLFDAHESDDFIKGDLLAGYAIPTKEIAPRTHRTRWHDQIGFLRNGQKRRRAVEVVWDLILYYANTDQRLLQTKSDWTNSRPGQGFHQTKSKLTVKSPDNLPRKNISVGAFTEDGMIISALDSSDAYSAIGMCPTIFKSTSNF